MSKYFERLCGLVRKGIVQYNMIQNGDKVCVGVSGGKDSVALTLALAKVHHLYEMCRHLPRRSQKFPAGAA